MLRTKLDQARDNVAMLELSMKSARADLALAVCDEAKQTVLKMGKTLESLPPLFKELPTQASLDNTERRRQATKLSSEIQGSLKKLEGLLIGIQADWQKDAR